MRLFKIPLHYDFAPNISHQKTLKLQNEINIPVSVEASSHIYFLNDNYKGVTIKHTQGNLPLIFMYYLNHLNSCN